MEMSIYNQCCNHHGKIVRITCHDGRVHVGRITRVERDMVWIQPNRGLGGFGLGFFGDGFGFGGFRTGFGTGFGIALGAIAGIALVSAFFW
ncbi:hypothetical protein AMD00_21050 [Viridibacillus arvi]|uniref:Uncharacterized protein n=2 Tax=Viridibacillus arvi TaxID=263475 RepID=A0A0M0LAG4_9BACL|nr:hypothetical protein [Viridibacillus arvi]KOO48085.1 hypothetical protein AMD00_21050 [Viridibacillus arvi]